MLFAKAVFFAFPDALDVGTVVGSYDCVLLLSRLLGRCDELYGCLVLVGDQIDWAAAALPHQNLRNVYLIVHVCQVGVSEGLSS